MDGDDENVQHPSSRSKVAEATCGIKYLKGIKLADYGQRVSRI